MLNNILPDYKKIREEYFRFGEKLVRSEEMLQHEKAGYFSKDKWQSVGSMGLHGITVPVEMGGRGYNALQACAAYEGMGRGCINNGLLFSIGAHYLGSVVPLILHGSNEMKEQYLFSLASGKLIAANAITEHDSGSDVFSMQGSVAVQHDSFVITAQKKYITNAPHADVFLVYVCNDKAKGFFGGVSAFLVPAETAGIEVSDAKDKMGLKTCHMAHVTFDEVRVEKRNLIGQIGGGAGIFSESMIWERVVLAAAHIGQLERVLCKTVVFCNSRKVNGKKITEFQNISHALAEVKTIIQAGRLLVYDAAHAIDKKSADSLSKSSVAKLFVSANGVEAVKKMQQLYGAAGYLTENTIEREYRDLYASLIYSGTTDIQKNIISAYL